METVLVGRACGEHPYCPMPCVQCAGMTLSFRDQVRGGFNGPLPSFDVVKTDERSDAVLIAEAEIKTTVSGWGRQKQLHAVGESFYR